MMGLLGHLFSDLMVRSMGWTILHSLWQGLIITLIFIILMVQFKKSPANTRYLIGVCMLVLMVLVSLLTFLLVYQNGVEQNTPEVSSMGSEPRPPGNRTGGFFGSIRSCFNRNLPAVVTLWLMGLMFFSMKFVSGIFFTGRLRHHQTREVPPFWKKRLSDLSRRLKIQRPVGFRESLATGIPLTLGWFKPLILFPLGILGQMPPAQVEALIVHELAHIMRRDYIVNIFQNLVDIVYFYHPGIRWFSQQVRDERENCCDDITVDLVGDSLTYARALTRVGEFSLEYRDGLAMAAFRGSSRLFKRIRRLFVMKKERSKTMAGLLGFLMMAVLGLTLVFWLNASGWLVAGPTRADDAAGMKRGNPSKEEIKRLKERHRKLSARESRLTLEEEKEMQEIEAKLIAIKEMEEKKKRQALVEEMERLEARESALLEAESERLRLMEEQLKQYQIQESKGREEEKRMKEFALQAAIEEERKLREEERMEREAALRVSREKERQLRDQERKLKEQELKELEREREMELKLMKLKVEYERLGQEIRYLSEKKKLTHKEKNQLKELRKKRDQIRETLKTHR